MLTIAIDCRFAGTPSGLGRYTREIVAALLKRSDGVSYHLLVPAGARDWLRSLPASTTMRATDIRAPHYSLAEHIELPRALRRIKADLLFSPHFNVPIWCPVPFVTTIHDLILHRYPNSASLPKRLAYRFLMRHAVGQARAIITVSRFVERELTEAYGFGIAEKIVVIREGVSPRFAPVSSEAQAAVCRRYGIDPGFFLYVGNAKEHKNVPMLLRAFESAGVEERLLLVGVGSEAERLRLPPNAARLASVDDADLPALYSAARCLVTASLYEGFCLPVIEALACGCPVIASRIGPIEENAEGHAMLVEPTLAAFVAAFRRPPPKTVRFRAPSWEKTAEETVSVLRRSI